MAPDAGRDTIEILRAAAARELDVLYLVGIDPLRDVPDAALARSALRNVETVVVQSLELGDLEPYASVFLPAASLLERDGHLSDWEGRSQRVHPLRAAAGISRPDWEIFAGLAAAAGDDLGFDTLEELHDEMGRLLAPRETSDLPAPADAPGSPTEGLTLLTYPLLIDEGRMSEGTDGLKAALEEPAFAEMHPADANAGGLTPAADVRLRTDAGETVLPLRVTEAIAPGTIFVPFNQPGLAANTLLSGAFTVPVQAEPAIEAAADVERAADAAPAAAAVGGDAA
jgi:formate dehydrogenase major subunit